MGVEEATSVDAGGYSFVPGAYVGQGSGTMVAKLEYRSWLRWAMPGISFVVSKASPVESHPRIVGKSTPPKSKEAGCKRSYPERCHGPRKLTPTPEPSLLIHDASSTT